MTDLPLTTYRALVRDVPTALLLLAIDGSVLHANPEARRLLGGGLSGRHLDRLMSAPDAERWHAYIHRCAAQPTGSSAFLPGVRLEVDGRTAVVQASCRLLRDEAGTRALALSLVDVTEHEQRAHELARRATTDELTGLGNRAALLDVAGRLGAALSGSVLMLDLDGFKRVNDALGHAAGDRLLIAVADSLREQVPESGSAYRLGGDEFVVLLPGRSSSAALVLGQNIRRAISVPRHLGGSTEDGDVAVTATIGIAELGPAGMQHALTEADRAMYSGKAAGGSCVVVHDPAERSVRQRSRDLQAEMLRLTADNARLLHESRHDVGTGLLNLRALLEELPVLHGQSLASGTTYGVVFIDLDHFGLVNKSRGDLAGDQVLARVAAVLSAATRSTDPLYRKGGEELVVLVPDADLAATTSVAARLQEALRSARIPHGGDGIEHVSASFGCAVGAVDPELSPRHVLERAGLCMLRAKNSGRDRIETRPMPVTSA